MFSLNSSKSNNHFHALLTIYVLNVTRYILNQLHSTFHVFNELKYEKKPKLFSCFVDYRVFNATRIEIEHVRVQLVKAINTGYLLFKSKRLYNHDFMTTYFSENGKKSQWHEK